MNDINHFNYNSKRHFKNTEIMELNSVFERCHNYIYANEGLLQEKIFNEILKLIFMKYVDEINNFPNIQFYISDKEFEELENGKESLFMDRINNLFENIKKEYFSFYIDSKEEINLKPLSIGFIIKNLQSHSFLNTSADVKGIAFQKFIYKHQRGGRGEFFTPPPIIRIAVNILNPGVNQKIIDPACGSGGFLTESLNFVRKKSHREIKNIIGIDINPELVKVAKMRMILDDGNHKGIYDANSLLSFEELNDITEKMKIMPEFKPVPNSFDILMTNPPFGSKGKIRDKNILKQYELGHKWIKGREKWEKTNKLLSGEAPEVLFIERCLNFLRDRGRMAIVLPDGILENPRQEYIRQFIKNKAKLLAIIKLPMGTFIPYGTGINASVLFLERKSENSVDEDGDYNIFFANIEKIGYETTKNGNTVYLKNNNGEIIQNDTGIPIIDEDISYITECYNNYILKGNFKQSDNVFTRKFSEIEGRFDVKYYQPKYKKLRDTLIKSGAKHLKDVAKIVNKKADILRNNDKIIKYVEISNVNPSTNEIISFTKMRVHEAPARAKFEIKEGNIITAVAGNSTGTDNHATAYVNEKFDGCICTNGFRVLEPRGLDPYYLLYVLNRKETLMQFYQFRTGAAIPFVSNEDLKRILILNLEDDLKNYISKKIRESHELRQKSIEMLEHLEEKIDNLLKTS